MSEDVPPIPSCPKINDSLFPPRDGWRKLVKGLSKRRQEAILNLIEAACEISRKVEYSKDYTNYLHKMANRARITGESHTKYIESTRVTDISGASSRVHESILKLKKLL